MNQTDWVVFSRSVMHVICGGEAKFEQAEYSFRRQTLHCRRCREVVPEAVLFLAKASGAYEELAHAESRARWLQEFYEITREGKKKHRYLSRLFDWPNSL